MKKSTEKKRIKAVIPTDCRGFQKLFRDYIEEKLPIAFEAAFVRHVRSCGDCMEELKAYYMFYSSIRYLNENEDEDMPQNVEQLLHKTESKIAFLRKKKRNIMIAVTSFILGAGVLLAMIFNGQSIRF